MFACGTAAVITPIGLLKDHADSYPVTPARPVRSPPRCARSCSTSSTAGPKTPTAGSAGSPDPPLVPIRLTRSGPSHLRRRSGFGQPLGFRRAGARVATEPARVSGNGSGSGMAPLGFPPIRSGCTQPLYVDVVQLPETRADSRFQPAAPRTERRPPNPSVGPQTRADSRVAAASAPNRGAGLEPKRSLKPTRRSRQPTSGARCRAGQIERSCCMMGLCSTWR